MHDSARRHGRHRVPGGRRRALCVVLVALLAFVVGLVGTAGTAFAQSLEDGPAPPDCNTGVTTTAAGQDPWCLISFENSRGDGSNVPTLGTYTLHVNSHADTSVDIAMPQGGAINSVGCSTCQQVFQTYQRDTDTNARIANGAIRLGVPFCPAGSGTCQLTFSHQLYPTGATVAPGWVFYSAEYKCPSCQFGTAIGEAGIHIIWDDSSSTTAAFTDANTGVAGQFQFSSTSSSASGTPSDAWDFGDGHTGTGRTITHSYTKPGTYTVTLTSTGPDGGSATVSHTVAVAAPALSVAISLSDQPPLALPEDLTATVTVSASSDGLGALSGLTFAGAR